MSQGPIPMTAGGGGASVRAKINAALQRLQTKGAGTTRTTDIAAYEEWIDTDTPGGGIANWYLYDGTTDILLGTVDTTTHVFTRAGAVNVVGEPQGRLTLTTATPVLTGTVSGASTLFYALYNGNQVPIYDGASAFAMTTFAELSNVLANSSTGKAGPSAAGPYQCFDLFVWNDSGTVRLTRGPKWINTGTFTVTIATPAVVTKTGHGLYTGATWRASTTGALPTGLAAATDYFVTKIDADTFKLSTSMANLLAGTYIATSGSQSGTHTGENYTTARGTGAGTSELQRLNGLWTNKAAISNGPGANLGTYVGTVYTNGSSQVDWNTGGVGAGGTAAVLGVWNAYNRVVVRGFVADSTDGWNYSTATIRPANNSLTHRVSFVQGLQEDFFGAEYVASFQNSANSSGAVAGVGYDSISAFSGIFPIAVNPVSAVSGIIPTAGQCVAQGLGLHFMQALEYSIASGTTSWFGDNGGGMQSGTAYSGRF